MQKFRYVVAALALSVASPGLSSPTLQPITDAEKAAIRAGVSRQLKDPESARFRWLPNKAGDNYCGYVNARNSYGGYTGFAPFMVLMADGTKGPVAIFIGMGTANPSSIDSRVAFETCMEKGINMRAPTVDDPTPSN